MGIREYRNAICKLVWLMALGAVLNRFKVGPDGYYYYYNYRYKYGNKLVER